MRIEDTRMKNFISISDLISLLNMLCGFISIISALNNNLTLSSIFMIIAIMFDSVDGYVARKLNRNDEFGFGKNIDSLSDAVSFGVAPAVFLYSSTNMEFSIIISFMIAVCGILRLTRYNVIADKINTTDFIGFPIPGIALILGTYYLSGLYNPYIAMILSIIISILMISNVKYPKFNNIPILIICCFCVILLITNVPIYIYNINIAAIIILIFTFYYLFIHLLY